MSKLANYGCCFLGSFTGGLLVQPLLSTWHQFGTDWPRLMCFNALVGMGVSAHWLLISEWFERVRRQRGRLPVSQSARRT